MCEELIRFTVLIRSNQRLLADRFSEREETAQMLEQRMGIAAITEGQ
ncbi:arsenical resistance protein ArsH [Synechococcus sp. PROS-7-1]|nr:arsenical resistance protein ArsH [Synechococcus sp. PROS-7-1]